MKNGLLSQGNSSTLTSIETITKIPWNYESGIPQIQIHKALHRIEFDPFPCYTHDEELVRRTIEKAKKVISIPVHVHILGFETDVRTNGYTEEGYEYSGRHVATSHHIILNGKRTPIHPTMTKFIVGHEYGHVVEHELGDKVFAAYKKVRGLKDRPYLAQEWHLHPKEIFADDFRVLMAKIDKQYWPHPEIPRPEDIPEVVDWWKETIQEYNERN